MFDFVFWVLVIWFIINVIWMWFVLNKQSYQKSFAWINVAAVIIGFWVYYGTGAHSGGLADCFLPKWAAAKSCSAPPMYKT